MSAGEEALRVVLRVKPLLDDAVGSNEYSSALSVDTENSRISVSRTRKGNSEFSFYGIVGPNQGQAELYSHCSNIVEDAVSGVNCSIMAYGQTGSGKTFSMLGKTWTDMATNGNAAAAPISTAASASATATATRSASPVLSENEEGGADGEGGQMAGVAQRGAGDDGVGIIPRCLSDIYETLNARAAKGSIDFSIHVQVMQIYNERIYDLLQDRRRENPLTLRENTKAPKMASLGQNLSNSGSFGPPGAASGSVYVQGLSEYRVDSREEVLQLLRKAMRNRAVRSTEFNLESSRSHTILQLAIEVRDKGSSSAETTGPSPIVLRKSVVRFVDLAGSEKWRQQLSQAGSGSADMQREQTNINTSLHVLGNCVAALTEAGRRHIPFRDSVLTRILQDSLGGGGRTVLIATVSSPTDAVGLDETHSTLQFANRASKIKVTVTPHAAVVDDGLTLAAARAEIAYLRDKVAALLALQGQPVSGDDSATSAAASKSLAVSSPGSAAKGAAQSSQRSRRRRPDAAASTLPPPSSSRKARRKAEKASVSGINAANAEYNPNGSALEDSCVDELENSFFEARDEEGPVEKPSSEAALAERVDELTRRNAELMQKLEECMRKEKENMPSTVRESGSGSPSRLSPTRLADKGLAQHDSGDGEGGSMPRDLVANVQSAGKADSLSSIQCTPSPDRKSASARYSEEKSVASQSSPLSNGKRSWSGESSPRPMLQDPELHSIEAAMLAAERALRDELHTPMLELEAPNVIPHAPPHSLSPEYTSKKSASRDSPSSARSEDYNNDEEGMKDVYGSEYPHMVEKPAVEQQRSPRDPKSIGGGVKPSGGRPLSAPRGNKATSDTSDVYMASSTAPAASDAGSSGSLMASPSDADRASARDGLRLSRQAAVCAAVASKAEHRLISAVEYGKHISEISPPSPLKPMASYAPPPPSMAAGGGVCGRHGLAACILCQLGGASGLGSTFSSSAMSMVSTPSGKPTVATTGLGAFEEGLGSVSSSHGSLHFNTSARGYAPTSGAAAVEVPATPKAGPCDAHGVSSCVLCALRSSLDAPLRSVSKTDSYSGGAGYNPPANSTYSSRPVYDPPSFQTGQRIAADPAPAQSPLTHKSSVAAYGGYDSNAHQAGSSGNYNSSKRLARASEYDTDRNYSKHSMNEAHPKYSSYSSPPPTNESIVNIGTRDEDMAEQFAFERTSKKKTDQYDFDYSYGERSSGREVRFSDDNLPRSQYDYPGTSSQFQDSAELVSEKGREKRHKKHTSQGFDERENRSGNKGSASQPPSILDSVMAGPYASSKDKAEFNKSSKRTSDYNGKVEAVGASPADSIQLPSLAMAAARKALAGSVERYSNAPRSDDPGSYETGRASFDHSARSDAHRRQQPQDAGSSGRYAHNSAHIAEGRNREAPSDGDDSSVGLGSQAGGGESWRNITYFEDEEEERSAQSPKRGQQAGSSPDRQRGTRPTEERREGAKRALRQKKAPGGPAGGIGFGGKKKKIVSSGYGAAKPRR